MALRVEAGNSKLTNAPVFRISGKYLRKMSFKVFSLLVFLISDFNADNSFHSGVILDKACKFLAYVAGLFSNCASTKS